MKKMSKVSILALLMTAFGLYFIVSALVEFNSLQQAHTNSFVMLWPVPMLLGMIAVGSLAILVAGVIMFVHVVRKAKRR